ncbi:MAG: DUF6515 family protein [Steroidobacteraceae bacterium]
MKPIPALAAALCGILIAAAAHADRHDQRFDHGDHGARHFERAPQFDRGREHYDDRFHHDHVYVNRGVVVQALPRDRYEVVHGRSHYFFAGGMWYAPRGPSFVVVAPPIGVFVPVPPPFYTTIWFGGVPYYYADDAYYLYRGPNVGYEVVDAPPDASAATAQAPGPSGEQLFIYPNNGQSPDQQARDRYECHSWASNQTGFDPTAANGGVPSDQTAGKRADYDRAMSACLEGRGYTVK